jgi:hypothetical protein
MKRYQCCQMRRSCRQHCSSGSLSEGLIASVDWSEGIAQCLDGTATEGKGGPGKGEVLRVVCQWQQGKPAANWREKHPYEIKWEDSVTCMRQMRKVEAVKVLYPSA